MKPSFHVAGASGRARLSRPWRTTRPRGPQTPRRSPRPPAAPTPNKGDTAWMLVATAWC
jgi:hypothetical protein